jgi:predicted negative regulator of RcsB-dependent stress response
LTWFQVTGVDEQLTDQQQAAIVRKWFRENGSFVLGGLVLGLGALFGWNQWQDYQGTQAAQASELYESIVVAVRSDRTKKAEELLADLESGYKGSPYLDQARLIMAKSYLDRSEFDIGGDFLERTLADSKSEQIRHIARLRLARVRLQQRRLEDALGIVDEAPADSAFAAQYHDLRGDILFALDRLDEARAEYELALGLAQQPPVIDRVFVRAKLNDLGGWATSPGIGTSEQASPQ